MSRSGEVFLGKKSPSSEHTCQVETTMNVSVQEHNISTWAPGASHSSFLPAIPEQAPEITH